MVIVFDLIDRYIFFFIVFDSELKSTIGIADWLMMRGEVWFAPRSSDRNGSEAVIKSAPLGNVMSLSSDNAVLLLSVLGNAFLSKGAWLAAISGDSFMNEAILANR